MSELSVDHLLGIKYLNKKDIELIFETADHFKEVINRSIKKVPTLRDTTIANIFFENSTRTKLSFELAEKRLSADVINFSASQSSVRKGETLIDTVNNILSMKVDMVVMRHPNPGAGIFLSKHVDASIINAGDGAHEHPTQALLDSYSIREKLGDVGGKNVVIVGDILHSRVALSNIFALKLQGAKVKVCGPKTLIPKYIESLGVQVETNLKKALEWCDVANMLRVQNERMDISYFPSTREYTQQFGVNKHLLNSLDKQIVIMHPGPINRGVEITSDVADSNQSIILEQVENGVAIRMAVIYLLAAKNNNMIFDKEGTTTIVFQEKTSLSTFLENLEKGYPKIKHDNIIVNLFSFTKLKAGDVLEFLEISNTHRTSEKSFILVTNKVSYNEIPDKITVVPTIQEAKDIIEMEEIERDLGI